MKPFPPPSDGAEVLSTNPRAIVMCLLGPPLEVVNKLDKLSIWLTQTLHNICCSRQQDDRKVFVLEPVSLCCNIAVWIHYTSDPKWKKNPHPRVHAYDLSFLLEIDEGQV
jgi:hypothetical protein